jgi:hypothetical protein
MTSAIEIGNLFILFFIFFSVIWIVLFSFKPNFTKFSKKEDTDPAKCFITSLILSLVIIFILWMFKSCGVTSSYKIGNLFLLFFIFFSVIWIIFYSFKPNIVKYLERGETIPTENAKADPARCFVLSLVLSLVLVLILWMFKSCK